MPTPPPPASPQEHSPEAIWTWRYLRLALVALVLGLAASVFIERGKASGWRTSISDYYYTPVHGWFVAALVGAGVCMICLRGSNDFEDIVLNLAGMLAPIVAFVPTPDKPHCWPLRPALPHCGTSIAAGVNNNVLVLVIVGGLGLAAAVLLVKEKRKAIAWVGLAVAVFIVGATLLVFLVWRKSFYGGAHYGAAVPLFGCTVLVMLSNRSGWARRRKTWLNPYSIVTALMVLIGAGIGIADLISRTRFVIILLEADVLIFFGVFWSLQTADLWKPGLRPRAARAPTPA